jgi:hypothetical protein
MKKKDLAQWVSLTLKKTFTTSNIRKGSKELESGPVVDVLTIVSNYLRR